MARTFLTICGLSRELGSQAVAPGERACAARRFVVHTTDRRHDEPIAPNLLDRQYDPERLDAAWAADITYVPKDEG